MNIILNEKNYIEDVISNHKMSQKPTETISRVARYYCSEGYKFSEAVNKVEEFMLRCNPSVNITKWQNIIEHYVKNAKKYPLIDIDSIPVTQKELNVCEELNGKQRKRLMFTLICLAKFGNKINSKNNNWVNQEDKQIFKLANIKTSIKNQSFLLGDLKNKGLIKFSKKVDNINICVQCIDNEGASILNISDFRNLGYQYMKHCGEPYFECNSCGIVSPRMSLRQKYCKQCAEEIDRKKSLDRWKNSKTA